MRTLDNAAARGKTCILLPLLIFLLTTSSSSAGRFASSGPIVTLTLKDPEEQSYASPVQEDDETTESLQNPWFNFGNLRPKIMWSLQSKGKPLPNWVPNLLQISSNIAPTWLQNYSLEASGWSLGAPCTLLPSLLRLLVPTWWL